MHSLEQSNKFVCIYIYLYYIYIFPNETALIIIGLKKLTCAGRDTAASRYNGSPIILPPKPPQYDSVVIAWGVTGVPQLCPYDAQRR